MIRNKDHSSAEIDDEMGSTVDREKVGRGLVTPGRTYVVILPLED